MGKGMVGLILSTICVLLCVSSTCLALGVRPLVMDLDVDPGHSETFELKLSAGAVQEIVDLNLYQPVQLITGGLDYQEGDPSIYPAINWITLEKNRITIPPEEEGTVRAQLKVPYDAGGSYTVVVMVEPAPGEAKTGITFRVRYAVRVHINVKRAGLRVTADIPEFDLVPDEEMRPVLRARLVNPSPLHYPASGEVTIRDINRRLIERVSVRTQAAWEAGVEETRIYPGAEVLLEGKVTEPLPPGEYDLRLFLRYADGKQVIKSKRVTVKEGDFAQRITHLRLQPEMIAVNLRPGAAVSQVIQMQNRTDKPLVIKLGARDIASEYPQSVFSSLDVQLRGQGELTLEPHRQDRNVFIFRSTKDLEPGGYYGYLDVYAYSEEEELLETYPIPISVLVGEGWENRAEVLNVDYDYYEGEYLFSVDVKNLSKAHIAPTGTLYLKDDQGVIKRTLRLELLEGVDSILPQRAERLVASVRDVLEHGEYTADIRILDGDVEIGARELPLVIQPREE
ncbi:MAG: hypothetical protein ACOYCE_03095 [Limnochordia bacterium]|jgi:hypothetical protein